MYCRSLFVIHYSNLVYMEFRGSGICVEEVYCVFDFMRDEWFTSIKRIIISLTIEIPLNHSSNTGYNRTYIKNSHTP